MAIRLKDEMVASYSVEVVGIERTKKQLAQLNKAITHLRQARYNVEGKIDVTHIALGGKSGSLASQREDVFSEKMGQFEGRVQGALEDAMAKAMAQGRRVQIAMLRNAETATGKSGKSHVRGRKGPGREDSGTLIRSVKTQVETTSGPCPWLYHR